MVSKEATIDLLVVGKYFAKEWLTYIRSFGITGNADVFPLYVSDKTIVREISH